MRFVIATADYSGLGFAVRIQEEGHDVVLATNPPEGTANDPDTLRRYDLVVSGSRTGVHWISLTFTITPGSRDGVAP